MCFHFSVKPTIETLKKRFKAPKPNLKLEAFAPVFHVAGFTFPLLPVITNAQPDEIQLLRWGLIPHWSKTETDALEIRQYTLNARSETLFEKPSFKTVAGTNRALILVDGFFEWKQETSGKQPYFVRLKTNELFACGGLWDSWRNPATGEIWQTFTLVTTEANELMREIHNTKFRMPLILPADQETRWLQNDLSQSDVESMLNPFDSNQMEAYPISDLISRKGVNSNVPAVQERFNKPTQNALF